MFNQNVPEVVRKMKEEIQTKARYHHKKGTFNVGEIVYRKVETRTKQDDKYEGPYEIVEKMEHGNYLIKARDQEPFEVPTNFLKLASKEIKGKINTKVDVVPDAEEDLAQEKPQSLPESVPEAPIGGSKDNGKSSRGKLNRAPSVLTKRKRFDITNLPAKRQRRMVVFPDHVMDSPGVLGVGHRRS